MLALRKDNPRWLLPRFEVQISNNSGGYFEVFRTIEDAKRFVRAWIAKSGSEDEAKSDDWSEKEVLETLDAMTGDAAVSLIRPAGPDEVITIRPIR